MGVPQHIREAFDLAKDFLTPVLDREAIQKTQGKSLLQILSLTSGDDHGAGDGDARSTVINEALNILTSIHRSLVLPEDQHGSLQSGGEAGDSPLEDAKRRRMLHALLDLISLEGIYPSLSSGVGIPLQQRVISVLPAGVIAKQANATVSSVPHDEPLLCRIIGVLVDVLFDPRPSLQPIIRGRILSDIISGTSDLAFNPNTEASSGRNSYQKTLAKIIDDTPTTVLLPTLSAFLQSNTAQWFKLIISSQISQVPLRPGGVVQTIMFIASQFSPSLGQEAQDLSNGPRLTVQAIMQISRLLSSVPSDVDPTVYFQTIAPQLLALIDGDDLDLRKTASYVVGNGILGKRAYGAPGTVGHTIFVEPIFNALTANLDAKSRQWIGHFTDIEGSMPNPAEPNPASNVLVDGATVDLALNRLACLTLQHPNPGLVKRIVSPILLPLWGLVCFSKEEGLIPFHEKVLLLLQTYFGISVGAQPLKKLIDNLLWDGGAMWTYIKDSDARIALQKRSEKTSEHSNMVQLIDSIQARVEVFVSLIGSDPSSEERTGDIFLYASQNWLVQPRGTALPDNTLNSPAGEGDNIIQKLVSAKIAEKLLENFKEALTRHPLRVLELIKQVIAGELHRLSAQKWAAQGKVNSKVSLLSLANIVKTGDKDAEQCDNDSSESVSTTFSLMSTLLASAEFSPTTEIQPLLESLKNDLDQLVPFLPSTLSKPATTSSMLLEIHLAGGDETTIKAVPAHIQDLETHRQAMANLNSDLPPVQAEGLSLISKLIMKSSPVLDVGSTLTLLLSVITDTSKTSANDEYAYLGAIKIVGTLASRHPRSVIKTLVEEYADRREHRGLDERLRIGESLLRTVQDLGEALVGETAKILGEGIVAVAGRRGNKKYTQQIRKKQLAKERREQERAQRKENEPAMPEGWSISSGVAKAASELDLPELHSDDESPEQSAYATNVVAAWAAGASADDAPDDLRIRASAISILGSAINVNILGLGPVILSSAVELALATLTLEREPASAILRRASIVLIFDILKALEAARETRGNQGIGLGFSLLDDSASSFAAPYGSSMQGHSTIGNIPAMLRTLRFIEGSEEDGLARGNLRALIESLETWSEKSLMWGIGAQDDQNTFSPRFGLGDRIAGLQVDPMAGETTGRPRIEEIE
ncbi:Protein required for cell viability, putative [Penicillium digitatum]|uniref:Protein required for cell viability, putative n=3 Tax=Penicillium digitatum TaxID=36651 RepID=K9GY12_PEND2|nr:Protein required for cell viability, putative [Penicillium digitatum Pd1]EKV15791.1 Protein required for cell viability, putative [Penicillium digitatum Pd1]EKV17856.1 Protein required for cell viability, putative [Penicillium digitatum PHI26]KAG0153659.1 hypothetical protein PDIDSM_2313 [Penicillium digitatum]QQK42336.1 Protein required for cell viability, putative [Penicillium digitatum]